MQILETKNYHNNLEQEKRDRDPVQQKEFIMAQDAKKMNVKLKKEYQQLLKIKNPSLYNHLNK